MSSSPGLAPHRTLFFLDGLFADDMDNGQLYELLIWAFAGFLLLLIAVMWSCYYWASFRLRQEERRHRRLRRELRKSHRQQDHRSTTRTSKHGSSINVTMDHHTMGDGVSLGSRPRIVLIDERDLVDSPPVMVGDAIDDMFDCDSTAAQSRAAMSVGSMAAYLKSLRIASDRLGSSPRRAVAAGAMVAPQYQHHHYRRREVDSICDGDDFSAQPENEVEEDETYYGGGVADETASTDEETPPTSDNAESSSVNGDVVGEADASINSDDISMYMYEA